MGGLGSSNFVGALSGGKDCGREVDFWGKNEDREFVWWEVTLDIGLKMGVESFETFDRV
jgi:hypothetical protein